MDSKKTNKLITTVLVIALALILLLYAADRIDNLVASLFGAIVGLLALVFYVIYPEVKTREERAEDKIERALEHKKVPRTREGTIFEVATALILAGSLVCGFITHMFESRGSNGLFEEYVILFITAIAALIFAYHPLFFVPFRSSMRVTNEEQFKLLIRKKRVFAIVTALMALILSISPVDKRLMVVILICLGIAWFGTDLLFAVLHRRNK